MSLFIRQRVVKGYAVEMIGNLVLCSDPPLAITCQGLACEEGKSEIACTLVEEIADTRVTQEELEIEAEQILQGAEVMAQRILDGAKAEAEQIMLLAQQNVAKWKEEVADSVRISMIPAAELEAAQIIDEANSVLLLTQKALASELNRVDKELLHLTIRLAERVTRTTLSVQPEHLLVIIKSLAEMPQEKEDMCLHISSADADKILYLTGESIFPCSWTKDDSLKQGDIYLEHRQGVFDARIETQLEKMEQILREELMHEQVEQVDQ